MTNENIEQQRLEDFKKILTYHLVTKIEHFGISVKDFYTAGFKYQDFRNGKIGYDRSIFQDQAIFNACGLRREQVAEIFGYDKAHSYRIGYSKLIKEDKEITVRKHGTQFNKTNHTRIPFSKCYLLPQSFIQDIFENPNLLKKVKDAKSDYYTARQRRFIFSHIIGKQQEPKQDDDVTTITNINSTTQTKTEYMQKIVLRVTEKQITYYFGLWLWELMGGMEQDFKPQISKTDILTQRENVETYQKSINFIRYAYKRRAEMELSDDIIKSLNQEFMKRSYLKELEQDSRTPAPESTSAPIQEPQPVEEEEKQHNEEECQLSDEELEELVKELS